MTENRKDQLCEGMRKIGVELNSIQCGQFNKYYEMMIEKNKVMNLTAITEYEDVIMKHFVDSYQLLRLWILIILYQ